MVGGHALRVCLERHDVGAVTVIGRRATGLDDPKLTEIIHGDLGELESLGERLAGHDVALYCLGAYSGAVPDEEFRRITTDFVVAFAEALHRHSPGASVCLLSGAGADQSERSRMAFARYKGAAEKALLGAGFARVHLFRPGYIYPTTPRREPSLTYRVMRALYPALRLVLPNLGIPSEDLARAMVHAGLHGTGSHEAPVLDNRDIRALVRSLD